MMTGPGTKLPISWRDREPVLIDTGVGVAGWMPLLETYGGARLAQAGARAPHPSPQGSPGRGEGDLLTQFPRHARVQDDPQGHRPARRHRPTCATARRWRPTASPLVPVHTPGHASDHLCYYVPETRALFYRRRGPGRLHHGDSRGGRQTSPSTWPSLRRLQKLQRRAHLSAHGPVIEERQGQDPGVHRSPASARAADPEVMGAGPRTIPDGQGDLKRTCAEALHLMAGQSVHSHLKKLAVEKRVREERSAAPHRGGASSSQGARGYGSARFLL